MGVANIVEGYNLDGTPYDGASLHLASFVGTAGVGAMAANTYATSAKPGLYGAGHAARPPGREPLLQRVVDRAVAADDERAVLTPVT